MTTEKLKALCDELFSNEKLSDERRKRNKSWSKHNNFNISFSSVKAEISEESFLWSIPPSLERQVYFIH